MKLHLGCGARIEPGWTNIDLDSPGATHLDLRQPLPYPDGSVDLIYSEHALEHFTLEEGASLLRECHRVLKMVGGLRISVPSLTALVANYLAGNTKFAEVVGWLPSTPCQMLNEGMRLWGHQFLYDQTELMEAFRRAGFRVVYPMEYGSSMYDGMLKEGRPNLGEVIVEAVKS